MKQAFQQQIETHLNTSITDIRALHGGMIGEVYRVTLSDKRTVVAKVSNSTHGTLDIEGYMLTYLHEHSTLPVPEVLHCTSDLLVMTFIEGQSHLGSSEQTHAAELLAELHNNTAPHFGLGRDTLIGSLHQPNRPSDSWINFFRRHRLIYMAQVAHDEGTLSGTLLARIKQFAEKLEKWLIEPEQPALIHGDMWTTNVLTHNGRVTGFVDPAIYYGHAEIELAFSTLFGTFSTPFFKRYNELLPISDGFFEERRDIYNLYPLLVHVRLFGGSYSHSVDQILRRFGF